MLVTVVYPTMTFLPLYAAEEQGFFAKEGVQVHCIHSPDKKERIFRLAQDGDVTFFTAAYLAMEAAVRDWGKAKALCCFTAAPHGCMVRPQIRSAADLKGGKVMVGGGRSTDEMMYICRQNNWEPGVDVQVVEGDAEDRVKAFKDPSMTAVFARTQFMMWGEQEGFKPLAYPKGIRWYGGGICATDDTILNNKDMVQSVMNAIVKAMEYVKADREAAVRIAQKWIPYLSNDRVQSEYDILRDLFTCEIDAPGNGYMVEMLGAGTGSLRLPAFEEMVDQSFVRKAYQRQVEAGQGASH